MYVMKILSYLIAFLATILFIPACQKETAFENTNQSQAAGNLVKTASGDCASILLGGMYVQNTPLLAANYMDVQVNFSVPGNYEIKSDTVNGYSFRAAGQTTVAGIVAVRLIGSGTPLNAGINLFTIRFNNSICQASVLVNTAAAVYTFGNTSGACSGVTVSGVYTTGQALTSANTVAIQVNVSSLGSYTINTTVVNGISFSSSGNFTSLGTQAVNLIGSGIPVSAGSNSFNTAATGGCTFVVTVLSSTGSLAQLTTATTSGITCTAAVSGGNITNDGGSAVTSRGVCYSTAANPTTANTVINNGTGTGAFTSNISGLLAGTTYHVRAFAVNSAGTSYGNDISFTTSTGCQENIFVTGYHDVYNISGDIRTPKTWVKTGGSYVETVLPFIPFTGQEANGIFASGPDVYVAGRDNNVATIWKNGVATGLSPLPVPPNYYQSSAYSVFVSGTDVYAAGFSESGAATIWKNGIATLLTSNTNNARAHSVFVSGTDVYVAGFVTQIVNSNAVFVATVWKNGNATYLSNGSADAMANSVFVSGSDVYVVGKDGNVAKVWKNAVATSLSVSGSNKAVANSVFVYGTDVYIAGTEDDGNSINSLAKFWKNGVATYLTTSGYRNTANSIHVFGGNVHVAGSKSTGGANTYAGVWSNGFFTPVAGGSTDAVAKGIFIK